jgi:hypothetical protein
MPKTGIYLISDFCQYYDERLHDVMGGQPFKRLTKSGLNRREMFEFMDEYFDRVVTHGTVKKLYKRYHTRKKCDGHKMVIYTDEMAHCGEGKILVPIEEVQHRYMNNYASIYVESTYNRLPIGYKSVSQRYLFVGSNIYLGLLYASKNDWRSNCGEVEIFLTSLDRNYHGNNGINEAIWALDSTVDSQPINLRPMDFNIAPGLPEKVIIPAWADSSVSGYKGQEMNLQDIVSADEITESIKDYFEEKK